MKKCRRIVIIGTTVVRPFFYELFCSFVKELSRSDWGFFKKSPTVSGPSSFKRGTKMSKIPSATPYPLCKGENIWYLLRCFATAQHDATLKDKSWNNLTPTPLLSKEREITKWWERLRDNRDDLLRPFLCFF